MSPVRRFLSSRPWAQWAAVVWILVWSLIVAFLLTDRLGQAERQERATAAFCAGIRQQAYAPLTDRSTEFARNNVRTAVSVFGLAGCSVYVGELDRQRVDPEAFRPAPPPSSPAP